MSAKKTTAKKRPAAKRGKKRPARRTALPAAASAGLISHLQGAYHEAVGIAGHIGTVIESLGGSV